MRETEKRLRREAREILAAAAQADAEEDARWGEARGDELPSELARRESRLARIQEAKKALAERARERAAGAGELEEEARKAKPRDIRSTATSATTARCLIALRIGRSESLFGALV